MKHTIETLYRDGIITADGVLQAVTEKGWITTEDAIAILGDEHTMQVVKGIKLKEISKACNQAIVAGVDIPFGERVDHFNLSLEDQANINNLFRVVELGGTEYPYQADDGSCTVYSAEEIVRIYMTAQTAITTQTAYHNALKEYVNALEERDDIDAVAYGMELPEPYASALRGKLGVAEAQMQTIVAKMSQ